MTKPKVNNSVPDNTKTRFEVQVSHNPFSMNPHWTSLRSYGHSYDAGCRMKESHQAFINAKEPVVVRVVEITENVVEYSHDL